MRSLSLPEGPLEVLALGAHADDIEIGCGATLLRLAAERELHVHWVVFCSTPERAVEARACAADFLRGAASSRVLVRSHRDGFLPWAGASVKEEFELLKKETSPDLVLTHYREDRHQDHRTVSELTWNTFRNHLILEYEIPKYDGDFGSPNVFSPVPVDVLKQKVDLLLRHYRTQAEKQWFGAELFRSVARIRGMECVGPDGFAEGFYCRKVVL
ncbi:MAG TPA: PIG-L deacetylase family protein [Polyangiaceae bacterium]|nr:PIG-L deacetylase family protein [Polyangiaceae bacterium]